MWASNLENNIKEVRGGAGVALRLHFNAQISYLSFFYKDESLWGLWKYWLKVEEKLSTFFVKCVCDNEWSK